ncbi:DNA polymerase III subunit gamma/tau [Vandammella animalimorsus]|uniref:DNA polymerase III subunit gamma/tau n=1 Tax=Vandammella animalimorsus TaxID=2029117 RepID=A0A2A2AR52_9BURK|nr:DNA polymerase III subunit gamma/tau [Vandammella animalimorsus]PAT40208.1 DNA polymerase III subunit gamma/tau [Vandammella animalimorsus]
MSYLVLARKYRPHNFEEMVGQEHVVKALSNALQQQRLHHAYLFTGTRGVGKTTVSRILAKSLNCQGADGQGGITAQPCGVCQACQDIDAGRFVDYTELDAASNRGVEEVQSLMEQAVYKPVQGRFKVFMIDEVHMLSNTAFNAMLKTLEEPPEYLKFVLATTDPQKVPVTVLSRCLQFNLRSMAPQTIAQHLVRVLGSEGVAHDKESLQLLARAAHGSMRDALSLTDQAIAYGNGALQEDTVRQMLGVVDRRYVYDTIAALAAGDGQAVVAQADALRAQSIPAASLLEDMALVLQQMALYQSVPAAAANAALGDGDDDADTRRTLALAQALPADETQLLYTFCLKGREELGLAPDEYSGLVMVLLRLLAFKQPPGQGQGAPGPSPMNTAVGHGAGAANGAAARPGLAPSPAPAAAPMPPAEPPAVAMPAQAAAPKADEARAAAPTPSEPPPWEELPPQPPAAAPTAQTPSEPEPQAKPVIAAAPVTAPAAAPQAQAPLAQPLGGYAEAGAAPTVSVAAEHRQAQSAQTALPARPQPVEPKPSAAAPAPATSTVSASAVAEQGAQAVPQTPSPESEPPGPPAAAGDAALAQRWRELVERLNQQGRLAAVVRELAMQSQPLQCDATAVVLRIANQTLMNDSLKGKLQALLQEQGLGALTLQQGPTEHSPAQLQEAERQRKLLQAQHIVENDATVQWLKAQLGAEVVPGSIQPLDGAAPLQ